MTGYLNGLKVVVLDQAKTIFSGDSPALLTISSSQAVYSKCTTNHALYLTVFFKLQTSPDCSSSLSSFKIYQLPTLATYSMSMPPVSFPTQSRVLWYLPRAESLGTPYFHFLPPPLPQDKPFITTLWWRGAGLQPQNCSGLWPATSTTAALLCLQACVCTANTQCLPSWVFLVQILAPQDLQTILYSYSTWGNTSITAWPQTLAQLAHGGCGVFHPWRYPEAAWRWPQATTCRWWC